MGKGMPSAKGMEWKARNTKEARDNWEKNASRIFNKKPWYEERDERLRNKKK